MIRPLIYPLLYNQISCHNLIYHIHKIHILQYFKHIFLLPTHSHNKKAAVMYNKLSHFCNYTNLSHSENKHRDSRVQYMFHREYLTSPVNPTHSKC